MRIHNPNRPRVVAHHPWIAEAHDQYTLARNFHDHDGRVFWWREYTRRRTAWVDWLRREGLYGAPIAKQLAAMPRFQCPERARAFHHKNRG